MTFSFSKRSLDNFKDVHPDLIQVAYVTLKISPLDFGIIEGLRTGPRQHEMFVAGKSQLDWPGKPGELQGRHLTGHALDFDVFVDGVLTWDVKYYVQMGALFKQVALGLSIPIHWGGDNPHWKDEDHIELDREKYPAVPTALIS